MQPAKVELVKLPRQMTLEQFNQQYPSSIPIAELAIINEIESPTAAIPAGRTVKRVVGGSDDDGVKVGRRNLGAEGRSSAARPPRARESPPSQ